MAQDTKITRDSLRTPRAAAIAGHRLRPFSSATALVLIRMAAPRRPERCLGVARRLVAQHLGELAARNLVPFAGLAFLWFIGVVRDRIGAAEDRFFATVFLGTGLLFVAMLFVAGAVAGA